MPDYIDRDLALNMELSVECEPEELEPLMRGMNIVFQHIKELPSISLENLVKSRDSHEITNAERVRSMSDEELAEMMWDMVDCVYCRARIDEEDEFCAESIENCKAAWLRWLRSPAEKGR